MAKVLFNSQGLIETPTLLLQHKNFETIGNGGVTNVSDLTYKNNFNDANEVSFKIHKFNNEKKHPLWDSMVDFKIIYIPQLHERFEISVTTSEEDPNDVSKSITGTSLCEAELSQIALRNVQINTETDMTNPLYDENFPTILYRDPEEYDSVENLAIWAKSKYDYLKDKTAYPTEESVIARKKTILKHASLLHRVLEKAPHYSILYVADTLKKLKTVHEFTFDGTDILSALKDTIADDFHCVFIFDSENRTISVLDLYSTCNNCGYRGDYMDECPECGNNITNKYGEDTNILINSTNLTTQITLDSNSDSLKNCFYITGADDAINAAIANVNPNGTQYIYYFSDETLADMPTELQNKLKSYNTLYDEINKTREYNLVADKVAGYNNVINYINTKFSSMSEDDQDKIEYPTLTSPLVGYPVVTSAWYSAMDVYYFLNDSMMPVIDVDGMGLDDSITAIQAGLKDLGGVAVTGIKTITQSAVKGSVDALVKTFFSASYYDMDITDSLLSDYDSLTNKRTWSGTITLTSHSQMDENNQYLTKSVKITTDVIESTEKYIEQKITRMTNRADDIKDKQITSIKLTEDKFKEQLGYYSLSELNNLKKEFEACRDIAVDGFTDESVDVQYNNSELKNKYVNFYSGRIVDIQDEIKTRESQIEAVNAIYNTEKSTGEIQDIVNSVKTELDLKNYLGEEPYMLWYSYRREDDYSNDNYSSTGLDDVTLIKRATELVEAAQKELYKAGNLQYSLSATMGNLLALDEFKLIKDKFEVGNFIKVGIDDKVYSLRLMSYETDFDSIQDMPVEFSTVEKVYTGYSDVQSVLDASRSMATSYSSVKDQADKSKKTTDTVNDWSDNGINGDNTQFTNSSEQTILINKNGILGRSYDDQLDEFSLKQFKLVNNGMYFTKDGWQSIETGIGRFTYTDINGNLVEDYGIIAKTVVGNLIIGKELQIYNEDKSIVIDENGLTINGGYLKITGEEVGSDGKNLAEIIIDLDTAKKLVELAQQAADNAQASADKAQQSADKANQATEKLQTEAKEIRELAEKGVDHVTTYFYQSDSATELVGGEWTTNSVTWISGKYVWQKVITYYKDRTDNSQTAKAICISGANGQDGKPGENGVKGKGVKSITPQYAISDSNVLQPNEGWSDKEPEWSEGKYIWTRTLVIYDDNTQETTTPIVSNGLNSALSISTVARKQANTANTNASNALTTATSANTTAKEAETKAQQSLDQFLWLVKSGSSSTSLTLTDSAVAAITKQFIIKSPDGSATIIEGGKLKTDALKSNNYVSGNDGTYSSLGTFLDLSNGEIHTPGFYLDSVGNAFYQGTVNADAGYFGDANNNWYIGSAEFDNIRNKDDALVNGVEYSALISKGNAALTAGHWYLMSQDGTLGIQSGWTTINGGNYVFDKETQKYYDMGMVEPIFGSKNEWDNKFLYIRRVKDPSSSQSTWEYLFKVDKDGTIYENGTKLSDKYARKDAVGSTYLPISGGTVTGNLTVNGTLTAIASKAKQLTHTLSINGKSWNGSADLTVGTLGVSYGGTGKSSWTTNGIVYASGSGTLSQLPLGTAGYILQSGGTSAPSWVNPSTLNVASAIKATQDSSGNTISDTYLRKDFDSVSQNVSFGGSVDVDDLTAGTLLVSGVARFANGLIGNLKGTASNVPWSGITDKPKTFAPSAHTHTMANISDWETYVYSAQGTRTKNTVLAAPNGSDGKATFRTLVEADIPTLSKSKVGLSNVDNTADSAKNVLSASKLTTARNINGVAFDGTYDITITANPTATKLINEDLNNIKTPGEYWAWGGNAIANKPFGIDAFSLQVLRSADGWYEQIIIGSNLLSGKIYQRRWMGTAWSSWTSVYSELFKPSKSNVGLGNVDNTADSVKSVSSATKLTTARNITIGSAKKSFDGTVDISFSLADIGASASGHTHNYASKLTLAGTDYSCVSNAITITKANLQTAIGSTGLGLMTEAERSKLNSIKVSSGGTIDFSGVTASGVLTATIGKDKTVALTHNTSGVKAGTYKSVTVDTYGHVTAGINPTTLSGYGITDALSSSTKYALSGSVGGNALRANLLANLGRLTDANVAVTGSGGVATFKATSSMTSHKPPKEGHILHFYWDGKNNWDSQMCISADSSPTVYVRGMTGQANTYGDWKTLLDSTNYTSYTVKKDGTGASGTWGIDITGSATSATNDSNGKKISDTYLPLSGGTINGLLSIKPNTNSWTQGIRIHPYNNWNSIVLCGTDNTGDSDTSAKTWSIHNNDGLFYITKNGSSSGTAYLSCVDDNVWRVNGNILLHADNYNSYAPKKDGTGASGTWNISITGNAKTATSADSATKATQDGNGKIISSTYLPLVGGAMTGTIESSNIQILKWGGTATDNNTTGRSWYGIGTYLASDNKYWLNISNYWGINFTTTNSNRFTHNGNIIITSANIGSQSVSSATKATQDGAGNVITSKYVTIDTTQTISGSKTFSKETTISSATASTSKTTGALKVKGGIASEGQISADKVMIGDKCTLEYDAHLQCLNFVFA